MSEREMRCVLAKHSGVLSARVAVLGVISMPGWKIKKYGRRQRSHQLAIAATAFSQRHSKSPKKGAVHRGVAEQRLRRARGQQDLSPHALPSLLGCMAVGKAFCPALHSWKRNVGCLC
ncbi:tuzin-like [Trypanosoma cruzi cruzi]|nr:tuzin-like [Trypanosoma cruzi cruzi]